MGLRNDTATQQEIEVSSLTIYSNPTTWLLHLDRPRIVAVVADEEVEGGKEELANFDLLRRTCGRPNDII